MLFAFSVCLSVRPCVCLSVFGLRACFFEFVRALFLEFTKVSCLPVCLSVCLTRAHAASSCLPVFVACLPVCLAVRLLFCLSCMCMNGGAFHKAECVSLYLYISIYLFTYLYIYTHIYTYPRFSPGFKGRQQATSRTARLTQASLLFCVRQRLYLDVCMVILYSRYEYYV